MMLSMIFSASVVIKPPQWLISIRRDFPQPSRLWKLPFLPGLGLLALRCRWLTGGKSGSFHRAVRSQARTCRGRRVVPDRQFFAARAATRESSRTARDEFFPPPTARASRRWPLTPRAVSLQAAAPRARSQYPHPEYFPTS